MDNKSVDSKNKVIKDVGFRTNGELYIGVVGSVRSGKSTFIRKFVESKVLPYVDDETIKNKLVDDLPQSAEGKTIMTVEPKFVPSSPVYISVDEDININIRLVDCVGYVIPSSKGYINEDGSPRLVKTPWKVEDIPFLEAATLGTQKVIENHSHIGILLTSDGSFGEFSRDEYELVEEKLVNELKELNKPFVIVLNTKEPESVSTSNLVDELYKKYDVNVVPIDATKLSESEIDLILQKSLEEFEITKLDLNIPSWLKNLNNKYEIKKEFNDIIDIVTVDYRKFKEVKEILEKLKECGLFEEVTLVELNSATGEVVIDLVCSDELYNEILESLLGDTLNDREKFLNFVEYALEYKTEYEKYKDAIESCKATGYGISVPTTDSMTLTNPEIIKQGSRYGIKLKAIAPSIHMIKVDVESSFEPIIGTEEQSKILIDKIMSDHDKNPDEIWNSAIFGRKLCDVVNDGIKGKLFLLNEQTQYKFRESLEKVVNKGHGGMLAIIL